MASLARVAQRPCPSSRASALSVAADALIAAALRAAVWTLRARGTLFTKHELSVSQVQQRKSYKVAAVTVGAERERVVANAAAAAVSIDPCSENTKNESVGELCSRTRNGKQASGTQSKIGNRRIPLKRSPSLQVPPF